MTGAQMVMASWVFVAGLIGAFVTMPSDPCEIRELVAGYRDIPRWWLWFATWFVIYVTGLLWPFVIGNQLWKRRK